MRAASGSRSGLAVILLFGCAPALHAHAFIQPYQLPLPYAMYIYGAVAALLLSFILVAVLARQPLVDERRRELAFGQARWLIVLRAWRIKPLLQTLALLSLLLCCLSGLIGSPDPYRNINMTAFWVLFCLGLTYFCALFGDHYAWLNPWRTLVRVLERLGAGSFAGRLVYPQAWSYWPALVLYGGFIWLELMGQMRPAGLSICLLGYTGLNLLMAWLFGATAWFRYGEFFAVLFRLVALLAPLQYQPEISGPRRWLLGWPCAALSRAPAAPMSLVLFCLFMLSSTAFDGLRETVHWFALFWKDASGLLTWLLGEHPLRIYPQLRPWYLLFESLCLLLLAPLLYLAVFAGILRLGRQLAGARVGVVELLREFGFSLMPIAVVYHATHYFSLLLSQGVKIRALISDPFGWGWDLFGTAMTMRAPYIPDMGQIWNGQVALILLGHVASVMLAHQRALLRFSGPRHAIVSQLPMLVLMMLLTGVGLWILAQPLQGR